MRVVQAALSLYEREAGPVPDKISYVEKFCKMEEVNHIHCVSRCNSPFFIKKILLPRSLSVS